LSGTAAFGKFSAPFQISRLILRIKPVKKPVGKKLNLFKKILLVNDAKFD